MSFNIDALVEAQARKSQEERRSWTGEIGGTEVTLFAYPVTPADHIHLKKRGYADFVNNTTIPGILELIVRKAETDDGTRVFNVAKHLPVMQRWSQTFVMEIAGGLFGEIELDDSNESLETRKGN